MSMTIGRASLATDMTSISQAGDTLTFSVNVLESSLAASKAIRMQLSGLEVGEVIPITWSADSDYDGFYVVNGVNVTPVTSYQQNFLMRAALTVTRVRGGYGFPFAELVGVIADDADVNYGAGAGPFNYRYAPAVWLDLDSASSSNVESSEGDLSQAESSPVAGSYNTQYRVDPADYYIGACRAQVQTGSVWRDVVGRQVPPSTVDNFRLSNEVIRVGFVDADGEITISRYNGSSFAVTHTWSLFNSGHVAGDGSFRSVQPSVLRNDSTTVVVEFSFLSDNFVTAEYGTFQLLLSRGVPSVLLTLKEYTGGSGVSVEYQSPISPTTSQQISASTYVSGHRSSNTDADSRYYFGIPEGSPTASTAGLLNVDVGETIEFGISTTSGVDRATLGAKKSERQRIIT